MWEESFPKAYLDFRTFIMGITGNDDIFPNGMVYKGVYDNKPQYFRGETGAQDSIIPAMDSALGLVYPQNQLTQYLMELRDYRPYTVQNYVYNTFQKSQDLNLREYALQDSRSGYMLLKAMHKTFAFRQLHWTMVKKYILDNTKYPKATGGTPITTWLPNQMGACLEYCQTIIKSVNPEELEGAEKAEFLELKDKIESQIDSLFNEVQGLQKDFGSQEHEQFTNRSKT